MKKLLALLLSFVFLSTNMPLYATPISAKQAAVYHFEGIIKLYESYPEYLVSEIREHAILSQKYIMDLPTADEAALKATREILNKNELHFAKVFKKKLNDNAFIYEIYGGLAKRSSVSAERSLTLKYFQQILASLEAGQTPKSAVSVFKTMPDFYNRTALIMLERSSNDFAKVVTLIEKTFNLKRSKAISLALSVEMEYAQTAVGNRMAYLRDKISWRKMDIRKAGARSEKQILKFRSELAAAQKELLELKKVYGNPEAMLNYNLGKERTQNIIDFLSKHSLDEVAAVRAFNSAKMADSFLARIRTLSKSMKSFLPAAIGTGLFLTVFAGQASAANSADSAENEIIKAVSSRIALKREIFTAITENPDNIGLIYTGGQNVKDMVAELLENEGPNSLSAEYLISYIEDWNNRLETLLNNPKAMDQYLSSIKEINTALNKSAEEDFNNRIHKDLVMPQDNTAIHKNIPAEFLYN